MYDKIYRNYQYFTCHPHDVDISKNRYLKRRYETLPILSITAIYHDFFRYIDAPLIVTRRLKKAAALEVSQKQKG